jgi:hypothetical protein
MEQNQLKRGNQAGMKTRGRRRNRISPTAAAWYLAGLILCAHPLAAQTEFFGYYEAEQDAASISGRQYNYGYNKIRLDLLAHPTDVVVVGANLNVQRYSGQRRWNLLDFIPEHIRQSEIPPLLTDFPITLPDTLYLDNVYIKINFGKFDLTAGKQQISLGTGYAWNPLDIFNLKQLLDPTYEQTGVNALRAEIPLGDRIMADLIFSPREKWETSPQLFRFKAGLGSFDFTANVGRFQWEQEGLDPATFQPLVMKTGRRVTGGSVVGQIREIGMWAEGTWNVLDEGNDFAEYVIGLDHTFDFQTYLLMEYYHNGSGIAEKSKLTFNDFLHYMGGQNHSLMQDYVFMYANHPLSDVFTLGMLGIANLNDQSFVAAPELTWDAFENVGISLQLSHAEGAQDTEFGTQEWGVRLRLRAYF